MFSTEEEKRYVKMEEINLSPEISNVSIIVILTHGRIYTCIWSTKLIVFVCFDNKFVCGVKQIYL